MPRKFRLGRHRKNEFRKKRSVVSPPAETDAVDPACNTVDPASNTVDPASNTVDPASNTVDPASNTVDPASNTVDPASNTVDPAVNTASYFNADIPLSTASCLDAVNPPPLPSLSLSTLLELKSSILIASALPTGKPLFFVCFYYLLMLILRLV
jgi:Flp pilus assembly protein TadG